MVFFPQFHFKKIRNAERGQTSLETLLVVAFILVLSALMAISYFDNQIKTNVAANAKLVLLPYIEKNGHSLRIVMIDPVLSSSSLQLTVTTRGKVDDGLISRCDCTAIRSRLDPSNYFSDQPTFIWNNTDEGNPPSEICSAQTTCP